MSKLRTPLVCEFLEGISSQALEKHQDIVKSYTRWREGVYALYKNSRLYYVGLASNLKNRLGHHLKDRHKARWDRFSIYLTTGRDHLKEIEAILLRISQPKGNRVKAKFRKAVNLRNRFKRDIKDKLLKDLEQLLGPATAARIKSLVGADKKNTTLARILAKRRLHGLKIMARYKGKVYRAHIRKDGSVRLKGIRYNSVSAAGCAVVKHTCDGWRFWRYERSPGHWVRLDELRR